VKTQDDVHTYISERFKFPDYYGKNLDALYDCLTDIGEYTCVGFFEPEGENEISPYLQRVKQVLRDAEKRTDIWRLYLAYRRTIRKMMKEMLTYDSSCPDDTLRFSLLHHFRTDSFGGDGGEEV
jgi:ribonuclease inhibitor